MLLINLLPLFPFLFSQNAASGLVPSTFWVSLHLTVKHFTQKYVSYVIAPGSICNQLVENCTLCVEVVVVGFLFSFVCYFGLFVKTEMLMRTYTNICVLYYLLLDIVFVLIVSTGWVSFLLFPKMNLKLLKIMRPAVFYCLTIWQCLTALHLCFHWLRSFFHSYEALHQN